MSKIEDFESEAKEITESCETEETLRSRRLKENHIGTGNSPGSRKGLKNIQPAPAPSKDHQGNTYAVKHGAYSYLRTGLVPGCNLCILRGECDRFDEDSKDCSLILEMQDNLIQGIMNLSQVKSEDIVIVEELARTKSFLWIVDKWLSRMGPFKGRELRDKHILAGQDILKQRWTAANSMARICEQLGLSPLSRARLKLEASPFNLPQAMAEAEEENVK